MSDPFDTSMAARLFRAQQLHQATAGGAGTGAGAGGGGGSAGYGYVGGGGGGAGDTRFDSLVGDVAERIQRLEQAIAHGTLLEMLASMAEENARLSRDNEQLRIALQQAQQEKTELTLRMVDLAEKVASTALKRLEGGGTCLGNEAVAPSSGES